jgi:DNA replication licensing factor MCM7
MSLPVVDIDIKYDDEKGGYSTSLFNFPGLIFNPEKIRDFLSKFKGGENDLARGFANIGIDDSDDASHRETLSLKYIHQLVRVIFTFYA